MRMRYKFTKLTIVSLVTVAMLLALSSCSMNNMKHQGRYQLVVAPEDNDAFVIDTNTGQVWSRKRKSSVELKDFYLPKSDEAQEEIAK